MRRGNIPIERSFSYAMAELYLALAHIVRAFDLTLYNDTSGHVRFARHMCVPFPEEGFSLVQACINRVVST
jgi:hypothetical protein